MRQLMLTAGLFLVSLSALMAQRIPKIEVYFQRQHTLQDLQNIREELSVMNIRLDYERMEFDEQGRLIGLGISVDCNDGFSGKAYVSPLPSDLSFGFIRDYRSNAVAPFSIGHVGASPKDKEKE